jgi:hypothetical protein
MDSNTLYVASIVGSQEDYNDSIVRDVWSEDHSNMTATQAENACEAVYEAQGADAFNKCRAAGIACGGDKSCNAIHAKYARALAKGYKGSYEDFKRRSETLSSLGQLGLNLVSGLFGSKDQSSSGGTYRDDTPPPPPKTGLYIVLGLLAAAGIGTAIYFATKK